MPVLLAVIEAVSEPEFRIEDAGSTPGSEAVRYSARKGSAVGRT